jgi:hypothetical protein
MSNLLDKASVILTPTAYNNGEALCVKPSDGSGDFDFSRNSAATRVNAQGLVENVQSLGSEEVVNGSFDTDSDWSKGTGWTISGGKANVNSTSFTDLSQTVGSSVGKTYKITFEVSNYVEGSVKVLLGYGSVPVSPTLTVSANGTYEVEANPNAVNPQRLYVSTQTATTNLSIDNVSVKEVISATNTPRIDYSTGAKAFLLEPQSTNLLPYSEDFSFWAAGTGGLSIETGYLAPDGSSNATKVTMDSGFSNTALTFYASLGTTESRTIYARTVSGTGKAHLCSFNGNASSLFDVTEQWQRFEVNGDNSAGAVNFYAIDFRGSTDLSEIIVWGAQVENQSYATSYIPTSGASATRNQELCNNATPVINSEEGTLYAEISALADDGTYRFISASSGAYSNSVRIGYFTTSNVIEFRVVSGGVNQGSLLYTLPNSTETIKVAGKYKQNDFALWVNGVEVLTDTNGSAPIGLSELSFDDGNSSNNSPFFGNTKGLKYYPKALADVQLEDLTTI